jgi:hypothetical protein
MLVMVCVGKALSVISPPAAQIFGGKLTNGIRRKYNNSFEDTILYLLLVLELISSSHTAYFRSFSV